MPNYAHFALNSIKTDTRTSADWIESQDAIKGKTVTLDGERKEGDGLYFSLGAIPVSGIPGSTTHSFSHYETPLGFVNQNSIRTWSSLKITYYPENKEGLIQQLNFNLGSEFTFNYSHLRKYFDIFSNTSIQWKGILELI